MEFYLKPIHEKSFYKKAVVIEKKNGTKELYSYNTLVCRINADGGFERIWQGYSATTMRHVNAFLNHYGMETQNKKWWDSLANKKDALYRVVHTNAITHATYKTHTIFDNYADAETYADKLYYGVSLWHTSVVEL